VSSASATVKAGASPRSVDWGRVAMVPLSLLLGSTAIARLVTLLSEGPSSVGDRSVTVLTAALSAAFYALIVWAYLRRGPATATSSVRLALIAAPVATLLPFALPHLATGGAAGVTLLVGDLLLVLGLAFSVWSIRHLDRSLSVVPQARVLVDSGPYATVRHPLYLGELVAMLGLALALGGLAPLLCWAALVALQCYRAVQEESLLGDALPGYEAYRARTARVIPGLF
jgi:protein-S-isoprenylcysteine O-methyltransferase Ste14